MKEKKLKFRKVEAKDVEVRVSRYTAKGAALLIYKTARTDANILDDTVGPMNWKLEYKNGNRNCVISIRDENGEWVDKEGVGDANEESENFAKTLASDSLKRAGFAWGIGRELYNMTSVNVPCETVKDGFKYKAADKDKWKFFGAKVADIAFDEDDNCTRLVIVDNWGKTIYSFGKQVEQKAEQEVEHEDAPTEVITDDQKAELEELIEKTGTYTKSFCKFYKVSTLAELPKSEFSDALTRLNKKLQKGA